MSAFEYDKEREQRQKQQMGWVDATCREGRFRVREYCRQSPPVEGPKGSYYPQVRSFDEAGNEISVHRACSQYQPLYVNGFC